MPRFLTLILLALVLLAPSCRHHRFFSKDGAFTSAGYHFVPQDTRSQQLSRGDKKGELIGKIRFTGTNVRVQPIRLGNYSRYTLRLTTDGKAKGVAELAGRSRNRFALVHKNGVIDASREAPDKLPKDWVCLLSMEGNLCLMAWNRKTGGPNPKFNARTSKRNAVFKVLELDDPRYHHDGFPLKELKD